MRLFGIGQHLLKVGPGQALRQGEEQVDPFRGFFIPVPQFLKASFEGGVVFIPGGRRITVVCPDRPERMEAGAIYFARGAMCQ
jgi:hypothetical protein